LSALSIDAARANSHTHVTEQDIAEGIVVFSKERLEELASEYRHDYPGIDKLILRFSGRRKEFCYDELKEFAEMVWIDVDDRCRSTLQYSWAGGYGERPDELAAVLLKLGVLQIKASRTSPPQSVDGGRPANIHTGSWFAVHPMYQAALNLLGT
jgi:hypothetical protein